MDAGWYWVRRRSDRREVIASRDGDGYRVMPAHAYCAPDVWRETGPKEFAPFIEVLGRIPDWVPNG